MQEFGRLSKRVDISEASGVAIACGKLVPLAEV